MGKRVLVTGAAGTLGVRVLRALIDEGADVSALVRPGTEDQLGALQSRVTVIPADVWTPASLKGRGRGQQVVIHLVGGIRPDPKRGVTFRTLNYDSARNIAQMAVSDGVGHFILLSVAGNLPGVGGAYLDNKRDAEEYLRTTGLVWTILRAPPIYTPGVRRNPIYALLSLIRLIPPFNILLTTIAPLSADVMARAVARLALNADLVNNRIIGPGQLRRLGRAVSPRMANVPPPAKVDGRDPLEDVPFGWLP
jgi:uncharacterized protein YbjT (DUF2867 family)